MDGHLDNPMNVDRPQAHAVAPDPVPEQDPIDAAMTQVLIIIPDVDPDHLRRLIVEHLPAYQDQGIERVLHILFEDPAYPKLDRKGKRKRADGEEGGGTKRPKINYGDVDRQFRGGAHYVGLALVSTPLVL